MQLKLTDDMPNKLAVDEVDGFIERNTDRNIPMTIKSIINLYSKTIRMEGFGYSWHSTKTI